MRPRHWIRLDWFELCVLAALAAVSLWVLGLDVWQVVAHQRVWTGTDGLFLIDQMQYLAWIQDASRHLLVSDMFVVRGTPHDYLQPAIVISGAITRLGLSPWLALLMWKPVAVLGAFFATRAYCARAFPDRFDRRASLVLALFFGSFGVIGDEWIPFWSWGYPFGLLGIAALTGGIVAYARDRARHKLSWVTPALGAIASFSHPWQGELMIMIVTGAEAWMWRAERRSRPPMRVPAVTVIVTGLPLLYFEVLSRTDGVWAMAQTSSRHYYSLGAALVPLLPLLIAAIPDCWPRPRTFIEVASYVWPAAALADFAISSSGISGTPLHAFAGITIPLAVLAVKGVERLGFRRLPGWRVAAVALVALATIPATVRELTIAAYYPQPARGNANFITRGEDEALDYLRKDPQPGAVLTRGYLGALVPGRTARHTYVGDCLWSEPDCSARQSNVWNLFEDKLSPRQSRVFVSSTRATFVLEDCESTAPLARTLKPLIRSVKHFGCATVYEVAGVAAPTAEPRARSAPQRSYTAKKSRSSGDR